MKAREKRISILLVDDDRDDQEIFLMALGEIPVTTTCIVEDNGQDAINKLTNSNSEVPDYIFLDINMPKKNGFECLEEMQKIERLQHAKVIMYSTSNHKTMEQTCLNLGAFKYVQKPDDIDELVKTLGNILKH